MFKRHSLILSLLLLLGLLVWSFLGNPRIANQPPPQESDDTPAPENQRETPTISDRDFSGKFDTQPLNKRLDSLIQARNLASPSRDSTFSDEQVKLGQYLFWDKILSGNNDISCAGCHNPVHATTDGLALALGTGYQKKYPNRLPGSEMSLYYQNTLDLFNRTHTDWRSYFWDNMLIKTDTGGLKARVNAVNLPSEIRNSVTAVTMLRVLEPTIMRGETKPLGSRTSNTGPLNQSRSDATGPRAVWQSLMDELTGTGGYQSLFSRAYPNRSIDELTFEHAARALTAFLNRKFTSNQTPWDQYLKGKDSALSKQAKAGAVLFLGKANCHLCHSGDHFTDFKTHNLAVPQLGPGRRFFSFNPGEYFVERDSRNWFNFRTPPLRNVALTGPWMHNGAYKSLEGAIRHHLSPEESLETYDSLQLSRILNRPYTDPPLYTRNLPVFPSGGLDSRLVGSVKRNPGEEKLILQNLDRTLKRIPSLSDAEIYLIIEFLQALTDPRYKKGARPSTVRQLRPDTVPSGLPVRAMVEP